jgi:hypothetical protein
MVFLIFSVVVFILMARLVPKKLPRHELYAIALFSIVLGFFTDIILDLKYNLYGYFTPGVDFAGFLPIMFIFPSTGVLFMNFYPFRKSMWNQITYILGWTIFSLIFDISPLHLAIFITTVGPIGCLRLLIHFYFCATYFT